MSRIEIDREKIAKVAWQRWLLLNRAPIEEAVRAAAPIGGPFRGPGAGPTLQSTVSVVEAGADGDGLTLLRAQATSEHAVIVTEGRKTIDHTLSGKVLRWIDAQSGATVYSRYSSAVPPNPFILRALRGYGLRVVGGPSID